MVCTGPKCGNSILLYGKKVFKYACTRACALTGLTYGTTTAGRTWARLTIRSTNDKLFLDYFQSKNKMSRGSRRGCIMLRKAIVGIDDEDDCTFTIHSEGRTSHFQGEHCIDVSPFWRWEG